MKNQGTSTERRYAILPQMREYDRMAFDWTPYVMFTNSKNFRSDVCNTDEYGFRFTRRQNDWLDYKSFQDRPGLKGLVCGGSAAFGVGASGDAHTISSVLNRNGDTTWFNFGTRAANTTQELLLFQMFLPKVDKVVLFSGVNNLLLHMVSDHFKPPFGAFFLESQFYKLLGEQSLSGFHNFLKKMKLGKLGRKFNQNTPNDRSIESKYDETLSVLERDLKLWRIMQSQMEFDLRYFLQPFASWINRKASPQETELFHILDDMQGSEWRKIFHQIKEYHDRYLNDLSNICGSNGTKLFDCNQLMDDGEWLFCDRIHLTDQGQLVVAKSINEIPV